MAWKEVLNVQPYVNSYKSNIFLDLDQPPEDPLAKWQDSKNEITIQFQ